MPMRPLSWMDGGCQHQQEHGHDEGDAADEQPHGVGADLRRGVVADEEPFVDGAERGQHDEQEREAVAALVLLERLEAESAEHAADGVRDAEPGADGERRAVGVVDVLRGSRRGLAGTGR